MLYNTCRAAHEAMLRPEAASALAATLCSLSPSAAAGQQLLLEVEGMLRVGGCCCCCSYCWVCRSVLRGCF